MFGVHHKHTEYNSPPAPPSGWPGGTIAPSLHSRNTGHWSQEPRHFPSGNINGSNSDLAMEWLGAALAAGTFIASGLPELDG